MNELGLERARAAVNAAIERVRLTSCGEIRVTVTSCANRPRTRNTTLTTFHPNAPNGELATRNQRRLRGFDIEFTPDDIFEMGNRTGDARQA